MCERDLKAGTTEGGSAAGKENTHVRSTRNTHTHSHRHILRAARYCACKSYFARRPTLVRLFLIERRDEKRREKMRQGTVEKASEKIMDFNVQSSVRVLVEAQELSVEMEFFVFLSFILPLAFSFSPLGPLLTSHYTIPSQSYNIHRRRVVGSLHYHSRSPPTKQQQTQTNKREKTSKKNVKIRAHTLLLLLLFPLKYKSRKS